MVLIVENQEQACMSNRFDIVDTPLAMLKVIQRKPIGDSRGYFERLFCDEELAELLNGRVIRQINHTLTEKTGTVRGLHYQRQPHAEMKFVACLKGEVYDVAVDLRAGSPTFLHSYAEVLSEGNWKTIMIPEGFAHGFQTLRENCELLYFHTETYTPEAETGLHAMDPALAIQWPLSVTEQSTRDQQHPMIDHNTFKGVTV